MSRLLAKSSILKDSQRAERIVDCTLTSFGRLLCGSRHCPSLRGLVTVSPRSRQGDQLIAYAL